MTVWGALLLGAALGALAAFGVFVALACLMAISDDAKQHDWDEPDPDAWERYRETMLQGWLDRQTKP